jgi:hypothetical protein
MTTKATRHSKSPAQRAQETVDILTRRLTRIKTQKATLEAQARAVAVEHEAVQTRLTYAEASPDLPKKLLPAPRAPHPTSSP